MADALAMGIFEDRESAVRSYCRVWPKVFDRATGSWLYDEDGRAYLDFFTGASALNYGHNNPALKRALLDYLAGDRVIHSLDMYTVAKSEFLSTFDELILQPRQLDYRVQFAGPGGANAVEAALKLARKATGRTEVIAFTGAFHGMTLGALAVTGSRFHRDGAGVPLPHAISVPFGCRLDGGEPGSPGIERLLQDSDARLDEVAAVIVETVQGEGGINVAPLKWLSDLADLCQRHGVLLIVDDVQMGCGRTGPFFSFEAAGIKPDIVCLSKSISGYGLPLGAHADPPGPGHLEAGRAQRHLPRCQPGVRHGHGSTLRVLAGQGAGAEHPGQGPAPGGGARHAGRVRARHPATATRPRPGAWPGLRARRAGRESILRRLRARAAGGNRRAPRTR